MGGFNFSHREHLRLAWDVIERRGAGLASAILGETLRVLATMHGEPGKYNETLTWFWVQRVAEARTGPSRAGGFEAALARGREEWIEPDLRPLPSAEKPTS